MANVTLVKIGFQSLLAPASSLWPCHDNCSAEGRIEPWILLVDSSSVQVHHRRVSV